MMTVLGDDGPATNSLCNHLLENVKGSKGNVALNALVQAAAALAVALAEDREEFNVIVAAVPAAMAQVASSSWDRIRSTYVEGPTVQ